MLGLNDHPLGCSDLCASSILFQFSLLALLILARYSSKFSLGGTTGGVGLVLFPLLTDVGQGNNEPDLLLVLVKSLLVNQLNTSLTLFSKKEDMLKKK